MTTLAALLLALAPAQQPVWAAPPIEYGTRAATDRVARLAAELEAGTRTLSPRGQPFSIEALLAALDVPASSQTAVFTKSSFQAKRISPRRPRALYFSDDVYVGFVPGGDVVELSVLDVAEGLVFYTLDPNAAAPRFERETHRCLQCHAPDRSGGLPSHLLRSLHPTASGQPRLRAGSTYVDHSTPHEKRWGGWYVTGDVGEMKHLGNRTLAPDEERLAPASGSALSLREVCDAELYPGDTSDVVALLVLEHQTHAQNALLWGGYEARRALHYRSALNEALGQPADAPVASTETRLDAAAERITDALLFVGEPVLPSPIGSDSPFAAAFQAGGRRGASGRSLRELDLGTRVFRFPVSYTLDSVAFDALPDELRERVWRRLGEALDGTATERRIDGSDRAALFAVLEETHPGKLPGH